MSEKPFQECRKYTQVHNYIFDNLMRVLSPNAFKVLMYIIRHTRGMTDQQGNRIKIVRLRYGEIKEGTGISGNITLSWALKELRFFDLVMVEEGHEREANQYAINEDHESKSETDLQKCKSEIDLLRRGNSKSETDLQSKSETDLPIKERKNKEIKTKENRVAVAPPAPSVALSVENVPTPDNTSQSEAVNGTHSGNRSRLTPSPDSAPPPPPSKKRARKTNPELFNHPFVVVWRDVFRLNLPEAKMVQLSKMVVTTLGLAQWRAACEAWVLRPYDPTNIGGILDWYHDPTRYQSRPSNGRGSYRAPTPPPASPYTAMSEAEKAAYLASCEPMED